MHFAHRLSDNTTSCQLRSEESALSCPRRPVARSRRIAHRKRAFSPIRPIKKCSLRKERLHFWGVLLKYRWRVVGCGVPDAPCTARKFGAAPDACTCHCRGAACRSRPVQAADKTVNAKGLSFYRQPVSCAGAAPGPAVPSPTRRVRLPGSWYKSAVPPRDCHGPCGASPGASGGTKPPQRSSPLRRQLFRKIRCGQHRRLLQPRRRQRRQPCRHAGQTPSG